MADPCGEAWSIIESRAWRDWKGLPTCSVEAWSARFPSLSKAHGRGLLGEEPAPAEVRSLSLSGYDHPLEVWSRAGEVVLVAVEYPGDDAGLRALSGELGEPSARLDWAQRTLTYREAARVFPARGVALLDAVDGSVVLRVNLFAPQDAASYAAALHYPARSMARLPRGQ